jgi:Uma2 family endonuclease
MDDSLEDYEHPSTTTLEEYLHTSYRPDVDFVDGALLDRLFGEWPHSAVRTEILCNLRMAHESSMHVLPSIRIRTSATRIRVADIAVISATARRTPIIQEPPALCIEVLEPQDHWERVRGRCEDFLAMGVPEVWVFDPEKLTAYVMSHDGMTEHKEGTLRLAGTAVEISIKDVFGALDEE